MNIEKYLALNKYLLSLFGVSEIRDLGVSKGTPFLAKIEW